MKSIVISIRIQINLKIEGLSKSIINALPMETIDNQSPTPQLQLAENDLATSEGPKDEMSVRMVTPVDTPKMFTQRLNQTQGSSNFSHKKQDSNLSNSSNNKVSNLVILQTDTGKSETQEIRVKSKSIKGHRDSANYVKKHNPIEFVQSTTNNHIQHPNEDKENHQQQQQVPKKSLKRIALKPIQKKHVSSNDKDDEETPAAMLKTELDDSKSKFGKVHPDGQSGNNITDHQRVQITNESANEHSSNFPAVIQKVLQPLPMYYKMNYNFHRHKSCLSSETIIFEIPKEESLQLESVKTKSLLGSEFRVSLRENTHEVSKVGFLRGNFMGSVYNFFLMDSDVMLISILFNQDPKDSKKKSSNTFREVTQIYINEDFRNSSSENILLKKPQSLKEVYEFNKQLKAKGQDSFMKIMRFSSQQPQFDSMTGTYYLNFNTKQLISSVKNAIFCDEKNSEVMKFYKSSPLTYSVVFENPLSWIMVYCYALATADFKLCTE